MGLELLEEHRSTCLPDPFVQYCCVRHCICVWSGEQAFLRRLYIHLERTKFQPDLAGSQKHVSLLVFKENTVI